MPDNPLVSIIIPVYNVEQYLSEALESVLSQTYENLEILIIDDGSTDGSGLVCDKYGEKDKRIHVLHQENRGLSAARNTGLDRMSGEAVAFLDPDDAFEATFIEKLLTAMISENADLTVCKYTTHHTTGKLNQGSRSSNPSAAPGIYDHDSGLRALADNVLNLSVWNKLYRRELLQDIRFPDGHVYEDIETSLRIFDRCRRIFVLDEVLVLHRKRPGSITATFSMNNTEDILLASSHFANYVEEHTPELFTQAQAEKWRQRPLKAMILGYIRFKGTDPESRIFQENLRAQILQTGKEMGIDLLDFKARAAWYMICVCPRLFRKLFVPYQKGRDLVHRASGR